MPLQIPKLDDRSFQDLVDEARRLIPQYCPPWTDHNLSDPGITLIELFATMVDTMIYRLNRVPEKNYITFMDLMGVRLQPPSAAHTELTFWLSGELSRLDSESRLVPSGTEVAVEQTSATVKPISFTTDEDLEIRPPNPQVCLTAANGSQQYANHSECLQDDSEEEVTLFSEQPQPGDCFYIGDANDLSGHLIRLTIDGKIEGVGIRPEDPPLQWEAWCGEDWAPAYLEGKDGTGGLNKAGAVELHLPQHMRRLEIRDSRQKMHNTYWIRCRYTPPRPDQPGYSASPKIVRLTIVTLGASTAATHSTLFYNEVLGRSNGQPRQTFRLEYPPVLQPLRKGEVIEVQDDDGNWTPWASRPNFAESNDKDLHFVLDGVSGEVSFGPLIREPDGRERQYGAVPKAGSLIRFSQYRNGGGALHVAAGKLHVRKSALPYIDRVSNRKEVNGGRDAEDLERAKLRAPQMLRTHERAVTAEDFEYLAKAAGEGIRQACCIQPGAAGASGAPAPGHIRLLLVPDPELSKEMLSQKPIPLDKLHLTEQLKKRVGDYLYERRLLTTEVQLEEPKYMAVRVVTRLKKRSEASKELVEKEAAKQLYTFLNPILGGPEGNGWPFGRALFISEIYIRLQSTPGVEYVEEVSLYLEDQKEKAPDQIAVPRESLIVSGVHQITVRD